MGFARTFSGWIIGAGAVLAANRGAYAGTVDPALERLTLDPSCASNGSFGGFLPTGLPARCVPDSVAFAKLVSQYAMAIAPTAMRSARTTGYGGFQFAFEGTFTSISSDQRYWQLGTQGPTGSNGRSSRADTAPPSFLQTYALHLRKGFPFGLELGGNVGTLLQSSFLLFGFDARLALLEGFREEVFGVWPDLSVGGGVRTATGSRSMSLTVASFDLQISKQIHVGDGSILSPYLGFQYLWVFGDTGLVDATPNTDATGFCHSSGPNLPGNPDPTKNAYDGQPVCRGGNNYDFNNNFIFNSVRLSRQRLMAGLIYRYEIAFAGLQIMTDILGPSQGGGRDNGALAGEGRQVSVALDMGVLF